MSEVTCVLIIWQVWKKPFCKHCACVVQRFINLFTAARDCHGFITWLQNYAIATADGLLLPVKSGFRQMWQTGFWFLGDVPVLHQISVQCKQLTLATQTNCLTEQCQVLARKWAQRTTTTQNYKCNVLALRWLIVSRQVMPLLSSQKFDDLFSWGSGTVGQQAVEKGGGRLVLASWERSTASCYFLYTTKHLTSF